MSICHGMSGRESNMEQTYVLLDLAGQVALRVCILVFIPLSPNQFTTPRSQTGFRACYSHRDAQSSHLPQTLTRPSGASKEKKLMTAAYTSGTW